MSRASRLRADGTVPQRKLHLGRGLAVAAVGLAALTSACSASGTSGGSDGGSGSTTGAVAASVTPPESVAKAGKLIVCGDASYPPQLYMEGGQTKGYDADIGNAIAATMGVKAELSNIPFAGIMGALSAGKCDVIVNSLAITPERQAAVGLVYYGQYGGAFLVSKGNPKGITSLETLCGKSAGFGVGTDYPAYLEKANKEVCKDNPIAVTGYPTEVAGVTAVVTGKIDTYVTDEPSAVYRVTQNPGLEVGGELGNSSDMGIATRKDDTAMTEAVGQAVDKLKADGKMKEIFDTYKLPSVAPNK